MLACVCNEVTLNSEVGVDQTLETFDKDVADRFRRRLLNDMNQVQRRRARSTPAIMKKLRYGIFPDVNRFKACFLAVLGLKMTGHPTQEQLGGAAKAKYNGLNPYDGLNLSVSDKLLCPSLSNWRILKKIDRFGGGATVVALASTAAQSNPTAPGASQAEVADLDPLFLGNKDDVEDAYPATDGNDDGDGRAPLSFIFFCGKKSVFQVRPIGCKVAKAATRAKVYLLSEAAASTAALESLVDSSGQRTALAFCSTPTAVNSKFVGRWWAFEMSRQLQQAKDKGRDERRSQDGGDFEVYSEGPPHRGRGGSGRGVGRRRGRAELQGDLNDNEEEDVHATNSRGGGGRGRASVRGRGRSRCAAPGRGQLSKWKRTVRFADVTSSSSTYTLYLPASPPSATSSRPSRYHQVRFFLHDNESDDEINKMGEDYHHVPPPTSVGSQFEPPTSVETAADAAAVLVAGALTSGGADEGISGGVGNAGSPDGQGLGC